MRKIRISIACVHVSVDVMQERKKFCLASSGLSRPFQYLHDATADAHVDVHGLGMLSQYMLLELDQGRKRRRSIVHAPTDTTKLTP